MHTLRQFTRTSNHPLSMDEIGHYAPSALALAPHASRSDKYVYIPTVNVIEGMTKAGFLPFSARQSSARDESRRGFTKHMIRFRHQSILDTLKVGESFPEVILINSHDGTSAYKLMAGLFRLVCSNGMVIADGQTDSISIPHKGNIIDAVIEGSTRIVKHAPKILHAVTRWGQLQLTDGEQNALAEAARTVRFANTDGTIETPITAAQLPKPRRGDDLGNDLWKTFNRVQENVIRGGLKAWSRDANDRPRRVSTREITGIDQDVKLNQALWQLAERMEQLKQRA